jgi:hypothetical protein
MNGTRAIKNMIFTMPTAAPAIPANPKMAAMMAMIKSVMMGLNVSMLRVQSRGLGVAHFGAPIFARVR